MIRACLFDVFGTVVDWHTSVSRDLAEFAEERGVRVSTGWSSRRSGASSTTRRWKRCAAVAASGPSLDVLHREGLVTLLDRYGLDGFDEGEIDAMNRAWHRLDPWPDAVPGCSG